MPKLFCVSDIHSFYDPLMESLSRAGFDRNDPEHWLIVCGDCFDRGDQTEKVLNFLTGLERKILVKGNHEQLLQACIHRGGPLRQDHHNGTFKTILALGQSATTFLDCCAQADFRTRPFLDGMVKYFETEHYIFVHGWLPMKENDQLSDGFSPLENFRTASETEWAEAAWLCGPDMAMAGFNNTGKTVVFGHWHTSYLWSLKEDISEFGPNAKFDPFFDKDFIALDGCTAHSGKVNCVVLEDEFLHTT